MNHDLHAERGSDQSDSATRCYLELISISLGFVDLQNSFAVESGVRSIVAE